VILFSGCLSHHQKKHAHGRALLAEPTEDNSL
jgi:hypothetical protein